MITFGEIRESVCFIAGHSDFVRINEDRLSDFAADLRPMDSRFVWTGVPERQTLEQALNFEFIYEMGNFCFWGNPKWRRIIGGKRLGGAASLVALYGDAVAGGVDLRSPAAVAELTFGQYLDIAKAYDGSPISLASVRFGFLKDGMRVLADEYGGSVLRFLESHDFDALNITNGIILEFPGYDDIAEFKGRRAPFLKRAQLSTFGFAKIAKEHTGRNFPEIEELTACADYKILQILRHFGIFEYAESLAERIDHGEELPSGSAEEVEIRGNTIHAVGLMRREYNRLYPDANITDMDVDNMIWEASQGEFKGILPHHKTTTWHY